MIIGVRSCLCRLGGARLAPLRRFQLGAPCLVPFLDALFALAAVWLDEPADIVAAVIIGDLLARFDVLDGTDEDLALARVGLAIRPARMIGVASDVLAARPVNGPAAVELVKILGVFRLHRLRLLVVETASGIFDDEGMLRDRFGSEQTEAGAGAADTKQFFLTRHARELHADSHWGNWRTHI